MISVLIDLISLRCFDWLGSNLKGCVSFDKNITVKNHIKTKSFYISLLSGWQGVWSCWILDHFELLKRELRQWKSKKWWPDFSQTKSIYFFTHVTNLDTRKVRNCYSSVWFDDFYLFVFSILYLHLKNRALEGLKTLSLFRQQNMSWLFF